MYRRLLVPLDGSAFAEAALSVAMDLASRAEAQVALATVREPITALAYQDWVSPEDGWEERYLTEVASRVQAEMGSEVPTATLEGPVDEALKEYAEETGTDLVVMATHGRGALSRAWLGSATDSLVRTSDIPILLVRPEEGEEREETVDIRRILVPLDGSDLSEAALEPAVVLGRLYDAAITLLRVVHYPTGLASPYLPDTVTLNQQVVKEAEERARSYLQDVAGRLERRGLEVDVEVLVEPASGAGILHYLRDGDVDVDLVVMATHGRGGLSRVLLGSVADKVVRGAHLPVLVVRPAQD